MQEDKVIFKPHFYLYKLDKNNDLLKASCLTGAYNFSDAFWVIPKKKQIIIKSIM